MHRVMIVDDHEVMRNRMRSIIAGQPDLQVVGEADCAHIALQLCDECRTKLGILDLGLPDGNGLELVKEFSSRDPGVTDVVHGPVSVALGAM